MIAHLQVPLKDADNYSQFCCTQHHFFEGIKFLQEHFWSSSHP